MSTEKMLDENEEVQENDEPIDDGAVSQKETVDYKDMYLRTLAEFDNFRKRTEKERGESRFYLKRELFLDILDVLDNFERAAEAAASLDSSSSSLTEGVVAIYRQFIKMLESHGVASFESVGEPFDPSLHEAVGAIPSDTIPEEQIIEEMRKGYTMNGKLLRPAHVIVSSGSAQTN